MNEYYVAEVLDRFSVFELGTWAVIDDLQGETIAYFASYRDAKAYTDERNQA